MCQSGAAECSFNENTKKIQLSMLILYKVNIIIISSNVTCSRHDLAENLLTWCYTTITHSLENIPRYSSWSHDIKQTIRP